MRRNRVLRGGDAGRMSRLRWAERWRHGAWPVLAAALLVPVGPASGSCAARACATAPSDVPSTARTVRPELYEITLFPSERAPGAQGVVVLRPAPSPFGVSLTRDGYTRFNARFKVSGLPAPSTLGAYTVYVAWATTSDLAQVRRLGVIGADVSTQGEVAWNKFLVFVTAEPTATAEHWTGPIVLRGVSPSSWLRRLADHPLFSGGANPP